MKTSHLCSIYCRLDLYLDLNGLEECLVPTFVPGFSVLQFSRSWLGPRYEPVRVLDGVTVGDHRCRPVLTVERLLLVEVYTKRGNSVNLSLSLTCPYHRERFQPADWSKASLSLEHSQWRLFSGLQTKTSIFNIYQTEVRYKAGSIPGRSQEDSQCGLVELRRQAGSD